jgi:hypothetical protein
VQGVAFSGLLVFDFTIFVLTMARSIKLRTHKEPFLKRLFIDGAFMSYGLFVELTSRDYLGLLYYGYSAAQQFWEAPLADRLCSVICNLNLVNVIVLFVRHFCLHFSPLFLARFALRRLQVTHVSPFKHIKIC